MPENNRCRRFPLGDERTAHDQFTAGEVRMFGQGILPCRRGAEKNDRPRGDAQAGAFCDDNIAAHLNCALPEKLAGEFAENGNGPGAAAKNKGEKDGQNR